MATKTCTCFFPVAVDNECALCHKPLTYLGKAEVLRTQEQCIEVVKERLYALPARVRKHWKQVWSHLYV